MTNLLENLKKGKNLSFDESKALFNELMEGIYDENDYRNIRGLLKKVKLKMR